MIVTTYLLAFLTNLKNNLDQDSFTKPRLILMNKLLQEKRYNDVLKVANAELTAIEARCLKPVANLKPIVFSRELTNIIGQAAYELVKKKKFRVIFEIFSTN